MAKEKEPSAHQLYKQIPGSTIVSVFESPSVWTSTTAINGWEGLSITYGLGTVWGAAYRTYIDISGWSKQELTTFVQGIDIQKSQSPINLSGGTPIVWEFDFITTRRLTTNEITDVLAQPGYLPSTLDLMQLIYGEKRDYATNVQVPGAYITTSNENSGSGNPSAMNKLHWTRLYVFPSPISDTVDIFPTNLIVQALTVEEKDLVWMERLRRSYVLNQGGPN